MQKAHCPKGSVVGVVFSGKVGSSRLVEVVMPIGFDLSKGVGAQSR
jgi:hypothetical protein